MNALSPPFYGRTYPTQTALLMWEATQAVQNSLSEQSRDMRRSLELAMSLHETLESNREMYNNIIAERDEAYRRLQNADAKLQQVERVVRRYAEVKDPVVASDGYTYERTQLSRYLDECKQSNSKAYSQQTKEELTDVMVDNVSLRRLAELLMSTPAVEVPQLSNRVPLVSGGLGMDGAPSRWGDEGPSMGVAQHVEVGPGSTGHVGGGGGGAGGRSAGNGMSAGPAHVGRRFDRSGGGAKYGKPSSGSANRNGNEGSGGLHPCLRVYGLCNFEDDCTFANYPYEACLNHIKGKCRFGSTCKELHVDPRDPAYQNTRSFANHMHHHANGGAHSQSALSHGNGAGAADNAESVSAGDAGAEAAKRPTNGKAPEPTASREGDAASTKKYVKPRDGAEPTSPPAEADKTEK
ncbi:hypothetical protein NESM_000584900 [Novymonas esmeraldas]|uniref:C3H1-type domain-containing protein n=1 Tax=Novymonas esmeraldas TaxID=1808958 RepID=A0AAW0ESS0_9TRYP